ncbi:MAG: molybdopterin-guanine dinucleotide biosynthesis protein B [Alphaproteobacteria bacterium]|nr:molybdopterin-guanine dinucleotide biosynthesis protein B [Alphaproteobacteria bacterium]
MRLLGIAGYSGSGKTTLVTKLIPALTARGIRVSTIKHAHHNFDVDTPGKDSYQHRHAGATEVLISSANRWALMHEHRGDAEPSLDDLVENLSDVDLVLVEGWKFGTHPKLEVHRTTTGKPLLAETDEHVIAIATDAESLPALNRPVLSVDDIPGITDFVIKFMRTGMAQ